MDAFLDLLKILLPAAVVVYAMYLTLRSFFKREMDQQLIQMKLKHTDVVLPIRLQAYERMCLFLERITPNNLIVRLNNPGYSAKEFQHILLAEIRNEYNHNLSQQVYMSNEAWQMVQQAKEAVIMLINESVKGLDDKAKSTDLARKVFDEVMKHNSEPTNQALRFIKEEIRQLF